MITAKGAQSHEHEHRQNRFSVIPIAEKLKAERELSGKGVTIAFLDSGFYPHPDFAGRVKAFKDIAGEEDSFGSSSEPQGHHWHGTQTVSSCAGDGRLSDGVYRGLASEAELVLIKVSEKGGRIPDENIEKGLQWVIDHREEFDIRVLNMSLGGDRDAPTVESPVNQLAEKLVALGVTITVAAGNSSEGCSIPPASSPSVITVGGFSDENQFEEGGFDLYHSNFGETADGLVKPELIAPAMFVAAPILPETEDYRIAEVLSMLHSAPDYAFRRLLDEYWRTAGLPEDVLYAKLADARLLVEDRLRERKIVATHYQHVDGTSFAAPITASVVAQMLQANPRLTPPVIKNILISTASRLTGFPAVRQGFGILNPAGAVAEARDEGHFSEDAFLTPPRVEGRRIVFFYHDDRAKRVALAGDFNGWNAEKTRFTQCRSGIWEAAIPCLPSGRYRYKLVVDGRVWIEDPNNGMKDEDGYGGFNSVFLVG